MDARASLRQSVSQSGAPSNGVKQPWGLFYPVCLFVEAGASPSLKDIRNNLIEEADKCQVTLVVDALPVSNLPGKSTQLAAAAESLCDADKRFGPRGAGRASIAVVTKRKGAAAEFCGIDSQSAYAGGCGQYEKPPKIKNNLEHTSGYAAKVDDRKATVAVVDAGKTTFADIQRTLMGAGMMGLGPGSGAGNGVGLADEGAPVTAQFPETTAWTQSPNGGGCAEMRKHAFPNVKNIPAVLQVVDVPTTKGVDIQKPRNTPPPTVKTVGGGKSSGGTGQAAYGEQAPPINKGQNTVDVPGASAGTDVEGVTVRGSSRRNSGETASIEGAKAPAPTRAEIERRSKLNIYGTPGGEVATGKDPNQAGGDEVPMGGHGQNLGVGKPPAASVSPAPAAASSAIAPASARTPTSSSAMSAPANQLNNDSDFFKSQSSAPSAPAPTDQRHGTSTRGRN